MKNIGIRFQKEKEREKLRSIPFQVIILAAHSHDQPFGLRHAYGKGIGLHHGINQLEAAGEVGAEGQSVDLQAIEFNENKTPEKP